MKDFFEEKLKSVPPTRLVPSHGDVLNDNVTAGLTELFQRKL